MIKKHLSTILKLFVTMLILFSGCNGGGSDSNDDGHEVYDPVGEWEVTIKDEKITFYIDKNVDDEKTLYQLFSDCREPAVFQFVLNFSFTALQFEQDNESFSFSVTSEEKGTVLTCDFSITIESETRITGSYNAKLVNDGNIIDQETVMFTGVRIKDADELEAYWADICLEL